jgi:POT family proton-dependent oligopeptide transporter
VFAVGPVLCGLPSRDGAQSHGGDGQGALPDDGAQNASPPGDVAATGHKASLAWAVAYEIINAVGYANFLPVGLALYARSAPKSIGGMVTGLYYVLLFFTNMLVGWLGGFLERMSGGQFWLLHVAVVGSAAVVFVVVRGAVARALAPAKEAIAPVAAPRASEAVSVL